MEHSQDDGIRYRIAVVEDDLMIRDHFVKILSDAPGIDLVGVAPTVASAEKLILQRPDLFLMDIGLPDGSGLDFIPIAKAKCDAKVLVITSFGDIETVVTAFEAGADGYLLKDSDTQNILADIETTLLGGSPISPSAATFLLDRLRSDTSLNKPKTEDSGLTKREVELLKLFAKGESYKGAAQILGVSPLTINNHAKSIYRKLAVNSRGEAVFEAVQTGQLKM